MKSFNPKFTQGSLFVCSKCGQSMEAPDQAEKLKTELRAELKQIEAQTKIRVMVGSCLGVCNPNEQTFAYYPNSGSIEIYTTPGDYSSARQEISDFLKNKVKST